MYIIVHVSAHLWVIRSVTGILYALGLHPSYGKGPHRFLRVVSRAEGGRIAISGIPNWLNYCVIFIIYVFYKCSRWPHNTSWRASGRRLVLLPEGVLVLRSESYSHVRCNLSYSNYIPLV
jgi:hypothetical protein